MTHQRQKTDIIIAAGGTGGHIFPALSVALQLRKEHSTLSLLWIGTTRSREKELCERHTIPIVVLDVAGIERRLSLKTATAAVNFVCAFLRVRSLMARSAPRAVVAFGGYVCAPALAASRVLGIPYFIHEQNTVAGLVNRLFAKGARRVFAGLPLAGGKKLGEKTDITGTPVRQRSETYERFDYPSGFDKSKKTVLICGGSQGAQTMNYCLVEPVRHWAEKRFQVVWQTGNAGFNEVVAALGSVKSVFTVPVIDDLYPYYACADIVVGRAGASTLAEIAYFGLPCVVIPLPWATENHQWTNAGMVEAQGWALRIKQDEKCASDVDRAVLTILTDKETSETMRRKALDHSPSEAAGAIVRSILSEIPI